MSLEANLRFVPRGRAHRATAKEIRGNGLASMIKEALDTCDEQDGKIRGLHNRIRTSHQWLKEVLGDKLESTSKELMDIGDAEFESSAKLMEEVFRQSRCQVNWEVFTVLLCRLSHEVDSAEREC